MTYKSLGTSYKSKSSKTKPTDLHYVSDRKHSDSKIHHTQSIGKNSVHKILIGHVQILET